MLSFRLLDIPTHLAESAELAKHSEQICILIKSGLGSDYVIAVFLVSSGSGSSL